MVSESLTAGSPSPGGEPTGNGRSVVSTIRSKSSDRFADLSSFESCSASVRPFRSFSNFSRTTVSTDSLRASTGARASLLQHAGRRFRRHRELHEEHPGRRRHLDAEPRHHRGQHGAALVIGNERLGLTEEELRVVDRVVEIPVYGLPYAYNVATAAAMALYEYCRQYPDG